MYRRLLLALCMISIPPVDCFFPFPNIWNSFVALVSNFKIVKWLSTTTNEPWECGANFSFIQRRFTNIGQLWVRIYCFEAMNKINAACRSHDLCYDYQYGREYCDKMFCSDLKRASDCSAARFFCWIIPKTGDSAYTIAANTLTNLVGRVKITGK